MLEKALLRVTCVSLALAAWGSWPSVEEVFGVAGAGVGAQGSTDPSRDPCYANASCSLEPPGTPCYRCDNFYYAGVAATVETRLLLGNWDCGWQKGGICTGGSACEIDNPQICLCDVNQGILKPQPAGPSDPKDPNNP